MGYSYKTHLHRPIKTLPILTSGRIHKCLNTLSRAYNKGFSYIFFMFLATVAMKNENVYFVLSINVRFP